MPTAAVSCVRMSVPVRRRANAMEQMTALLGSPPRWPHRSWWLNPL